jgi:hypothetical protein
MNHQVRINTGATPYEPHKYKRSEYSVLVNRTYKFIRSYQDELGTTRHVYRCEVCGVEPHIIDRNLPSWSGHCYCNPAYLGSRP